jgi:hypothetical protein
MIGYVYVELVALFVGHLLSHDSWLKEGLVHGVV